ncbi:hypothetical protein GCM10010398_69690 [Streptomyces fimbriatus]
MRTDVLTLTGPSLTEDAGEHPARLTRGLDAAWRQTADRLAEAGDDAKVEIVVPEGDGRARLSVDKLGSVGEPESLTWLKATAEAVLPRIDLPDPLFEVHSRTGFLDSFGHVSDRRTRVEGLLGSRFAPRFRDLADQRFRSAPRDPDNTAPSAPGPTPQSPKRTTSAPGTARPSALRSGGTPARSIPPGLPVPQPLTPDLEGLQQQGEPRPVRPRLVPQPLLALLRQRPDLDQALRLPPLPPPALPPVVTTRPTRRSVTPGKTRRPKPLTSTPLIRHGELLATSSQLRENRASTGLATPSDPPSQVLALVHNDARPHR